MEEKAVGLIGWCEAAIGRGRGCGAVRCGDWLRAKFRWGDWLRANGAMR